MSQAPAPSRGATYPRKRREPSRFALWRAHVADKLARSSRVFLLGVIVACGIEVFVDWNATLFEINVLRDGLRQRALSYATILARGSVEMVRASDAEGLTRLSSGVLDDPDVVEVRFFDQGAQPLFSRKTEGLEGEAAAHQKRFEEPHIQRQLDRDIRGMLSDPRDLQAKIARSRHRDFVQLWNDAVAAAIRPFVKPKAAPSGASFTAYQDRLHDQAKRHDSDLTYALATVSDRRDEVRGVAVVVLSMGRTNAAAVSKYAKGVAMVIFFVGLILFQNAMARRDKLRLLDLEERLRAAKQAIRDALPHEQSWEGWHLAGALDQAEGLVDGVIWGSHERGGRLEILVLDPNGDGIDAAATALHVLRVYRERREAGEQVSLGEEVAAIGQAALMIPLTRPVGVLLLRISLVTGEIEGLSGPLGVPFLLERQRVVPLAVDPPGEAPRGVVGPIFAVRGAIPAAGKLAVIASGVPTEQPVGIDSKAIASFLARTEEHHPGELALDAVTWARGASAQAAPRDLLVALLQRDGGPPGAPG